MQDLQRLPHDLLKTRCPTTGGRVRTLEEDVHGILEVGPASDLTSPGLAWDAMLLPTQVELELIDDVDMLLVSSESFDILFLNQILILNRKVVLLKKSMIKTL